MRTQSKSHSVYSATNQQLLQTLADQLVLELGFQKNRLNSQFSSRPDAITLRRHNALSTQVIDLLIDNNPNCHRRVSRTVDQLLHATEQLQEAWADELAF